MNRVFIIGCGDIGLRVARLWRDENVPVSALVRSSQGARRLGGLGISPLEGDLDDPATFAGLPTKSALVYYLAPPPNRGDTDPRMVAFVDRIPPGEEPEKIVYMSTTAVYGDLRGGWATEETPPAPRTARGKRRLDAENTLLAWGRAKNIPVVILRVVGIYGPGRLPFGKVREGAPVVAENESPYSNRIHSDDLARICVAAGRRGGAGAVYNVSDGLPGTMTRYYYAVADRLGVPRPPAVTMAEARSVMSEGMLSFLSESKRVDNRKMLAELGVTLLYPTLETGIAASMDDED